jgi:hypothetical protein
MTNATPIRGGYRCGVRDKLKYAFSMLTALFISGSLDAILV